MKDLRLFLLFLLMSMTTNYANAYDIAVKNEDGVTIYYNYINENKELEVTSTTSVSLYSSYRGSINIPSEVTYSGRTRKVTRIGSNTFYGCDLLSSVTIPNSVSSIGYSAFDGCTGLTSIAIPSSVRVIEMSAFRGCKNIKKVIVTDIAAWCNVRFGYDSTNHIYSSNPLCIDTAELYSDENTEIRDLVIPNGVASIGDAAFCGGRNITSITIPNSVKTIGNRAFSHCCFSSVNIPDSVTFIGSGAFLYTPRLTKVIVKDVAAWCSIKFGDEKSNPLSKAKHLYSDDNTEITNLVIPNTATGIGTYAFINCSELTSVTIPNNVKTIGDSAFMNCYGLTSVTIPNSVTSIRESTFRGCYGLISVTIPNSVTTIEHNAFDFTPKSFLEIISYIEEPAPIDEESFSKDIFLNAQLYIPEGTLQMYKSAPGWKNFMFIEEGIPSAISSPVLSEYKECEYYDFSGKKLDKLQKGVNILRMKDGTTKKVVVK